MLDDYSAIIAPVIAIINSVIAVSVSHFKAESQPLKVALLVTSIALGLVAAGGTIYGQYIVVTKHTAEFARRTEIHRRLGELIAQGDIILLALRTPSQPFPDANLWASSAEQYLKESLGDGYVERFRDPSGIFHGIPNGIDENRTNYWSGVHERVTRLQQFSAEISN
jgi:hypothetical protein